MRHLPAGLLSVASVTAFAVSVRRGVRRVDVVVSAESVAAVSVAAGAGVFAGYSYTKRFTALAHFWLGAALMLAPVAAWIAVRGEVAVAAGGARRRRAAVGGRLRHHLRLPGRRIRPQPRTAQRAGAVGRGPRYAGRPVPSGDGRPAVLLPVVYPLLGGIYLAGIVAVALLWRMSIGWFRPDDLTRVNMAFFNVNAVVSIGLFVVGAGFVPAPSARGILIKQPHAPFAKRTAASVAPCFTRETASALRRASDVSAPSLSASETIGVLIASARGRVAQELSLPADHDRAGFGGTCDSEHVPPSPRWRHIAPRTARAAADASDS